MYYLQILPPAFHERLENDRRAYFVDIAFVASVALLRSGGDHRLQRHRGCKTLVVQMHRDFRKCFLQCLHKCRNPCGIFTVGIIKLFRHSNHKCLYLLGRRVLLEKIGELMRRDRIKRGCNNFQRVGNGYSAAFGTVIDRQKTWHGLKIC